MVQHADIDHTGIPGVGGEGALSIVRKIANETVNNSAALQNDDVLLKAILASEVWEFEFRIYFTSGTTPDFKAAITIPSGATMAWATPSGFDVSANAWGMSTESVSGTARNFASGAGTRFLHIVGFVINAGTPGNIQLQWAQNTATASDTIVLANSMLFARKLA